MKIPTFAFLFVAFAAAASAQQLDARWAPWLGCWTVTGGTAQLCIAQSGSNGVTLTTRVAGEPDLVHTIFADATSHPAIEAGCTGTERAEWSADGRRLFMHADLACKDQPSRTVSGLSLITPGGSWLDVQAIDVSGHSAVRVRRYQRAAGERTESRRPGPFGPGEPVPFTLEAVKEAASKIAPSALEAALTETGSRFALSSRALIDLADAHVPDSVIDVMVALSYPQKFQVERRPEANVDSYPPVYLDAERAAFWGLGYPYFSMYPGYYGNYRYYSSPFFYGSHYGPYGTYYPDYYYPGVRPADGGTATPAPGDDARVVNGVGYTRVRPREAQKATASEEGRSSGSASRRATAGSSGYTSGSSGSSSSGSSGSGSAGSSSSSGSSSGGSEGGRTAQPR